MPVTTFNIGDKFVVRVIKYLITNPANKWANSYEFVATNAGTTGDFVTLGGILVTFEAALHTTSVRFDRIIMSTWEADSLPYDPSSFLSVTVTQDGLKPTVTDQVVPLGEALRVNRQAESGRFGNLFYRGALFENEVEQPAGIPILSSPGTIADLISDTLTDSGFGDYITPGPGTPFQLSMISANGTQVRNVTALTPSGVSLIKMDHQWFNRT